MFHTSRRKSNKGSMLPHSSALFLKSFSFLLRPSWSRAISNMHFHNHRIVQIEASFDRPIHDVMDGSGVDPG